MKIIFTTILLMMTLNLQAQNFKFGKVSKTELAEKSHPKDSSAHAAVLYKKERIRFNYVKGEGYLQSRTVYERIKIYDKEGFDWATKKIRLYNKQNSTSENIYKLKANTYNLIDEKIQIDKLKKDGVFEEEVNKYWKKKSFTMPNVKEGCVIEFSYVISSPYLAIDDLELQYTIPINTLDILVRTPEYFMYNKVLNPQSSFIPKITESKSSKTETVTNSNVSTTSKGQSNYETSTNRFSVNENNIKINETNIPALKEEPFVDNLANYMAKLKLELVAIKYPNQPYKNLGGTWDAVTKTIYDSDDFGLQLNKSNYYEDDINTLIADLTTNTEKVRAIFNHVKTKVKWNGYYGYSVEKGVRKAYKEGVGNTADINLMLVSMLRYAGVSANPVLISTKSNGVPLFPTRQGFNYVICFVEDSNILALLDATGENSTFNTLPVRDLNWQGRVIRESGSSTWIDLIPRELSKEVTGLQLKINSDLSVEGKVRSRQFNYLAKRFRDNYKNLSDEQYIEVLEKDKTDLIISDLKIEGDSDLSKPVKIAYNYKMENAVEEIGDKLYFSPLLFLSTEDTPFKEEERQLPIDLRYPVSDKYMVSIMIPEGYDVESLPKNEALDFSNNTGSFKYLVSRNGRSIQVNIELNINTALVLSSDYSFFKQFFNHAIEKESEQIVLKRI